MRRRFLVAGLAIAIALSLVVFVLTRDQTQRPAPSPQKGPVAKVEGRKGSILDLYKKIEPGMSRRQVEDVLGEPVFPPLEQPSGEIEIAYLGQEYAERILLSHESPMLPAGIYVTYHKGRLVKKSYNTQWVTR